MQRVVGNISCDLDAKVKGQIMYLFVIASPPNTVGHSNFKLCRCTGYML